LFAGNLELLFLGGELLDDGVNRGTLRRRGIELALAAVLRCDGCGKVETRSPTGLQGLDTERFGSTSSYYPSIIVFDCLPLQLFPPPNYSIAGGARLQACIKNRSL